MNSHLSRRKLLLGMAALALPGASVMAAKRFATPRQIAGPFYPLELPLDDDNDLTTVRGRNGRASGLITDLGGRIVDLDDRPLTGLRIEIWQCDANGRYRHPRERRSETLDENFQGHGHAVTDANGRYRFRTIRPVPYPGRTPHIHVAVFPQSEPPFVTQLYISGESRNADDYLFNRVPADRRQLVLAEFNESSNADTDLVAGFDIILNSSYGTPRER